MSQSKMIHTNHLKSKLGIFRKPILSLKAQEGSPNIKPVIRLSGFQLPGPQGEGNENWQFNPKSGSEGRGEL